MIDLKITDNISENSAYQNELAYAAELALWWFRQRPGSDLPERRHRASALGTIHRLIEKEINAPIGVGLERLTELVKGIYSGCIVFFPIPLEDNLMQVDFFHTIRREIVGSFIFKQTDGYYRIQTVELKAF